MAIKVYAWIVDEKRFLAEGPYYDADTQEISMVAMDPAGFIKIDDNGDHVLDKKGKPIILAPKSGELLVIRRGILFQGEFDFKRSNVKGHTYPDLSRVVIAMNKFICTGYEKEGPKQENIPYAVWGTFDCSKSRSMFTNDANYRLPRAHTIDVSHSIANFDALIDKIPNGIPSAPNNGAIKIIVQDKLVKPDSLLKDENLRKSATRFYDKYKDALNKSSIMIAGTSTGTIDFANLLAKSVEQKNDKNDKTDKPQKHKSKEKPTKQKQIDYPIKTDSDMDVSDVVQRIKQSPTFNFIWSDIESNTDTLRQLKKFGKQRDTDQILTKIVADIYDDTKTIVLKLRKPEDAQPVKCLSVDDFMDIAQQTTKILDDAIQAANKLQSENANKNDVVENKTQGKNGQKNNKDNKKPKQNNEQQEQTKRTVWVTDGVLKTLKGFKKKGFNYIAWIQDVATEDPRQLITDHIEGCANGGTAVEIAERTNAGPRMYVASVDDTQLLIFAIGDKDKQKQTDLKNIKKFAWGYNEMNDKLKNIAPNTTQMEMAVKKQQSEFTDTLHNFNTDETRKLLGIDDKQKGKTAPTDITRDDAKQAEENGQQTPPFQQAYASGENTSPKSLHTITQDLKTLEDKYLTPNKAAETYCQRHNWSEKNVPALAKAIQDACEKYWEDSKQDQDWYYRKASDGIFRLDADKMEEFITNFVEFNPENEQQASDENQSNKKPRKTQQPNSVTKTLSEWAASFTNADGSAISETFMELVLEQVLPSKTTFVERIGFTKTNKGRYSVTDKDFFAEFIRTQRQRLVSVSTAAKITFINSQALIDKCDTLEPDPHYFYYTGAYGNGKYYFVREKLPEFIKNNFSLEDKKTKRWTVNTLAKKLHTIRDNIWPVISANQDKEWVQQCIQDDQGESYFITYYFDAFKDLYTEYYRAKKQEKEKKKMIKAMTATIIKDNDLVSELNGKYDCNISPDLLALLVNKYPDSFEKLLERQDDGSYVLKATTEEVANGIRDIKDLWKTCRAAARAYYSDEYKAPNGISISDLEKVLNMKLTQPGINSETKTYFVKSGSQYFWNMLNLPEFIEKELPNFVRKQKDAPVNDNSDSTNAIIEQQDTQDTKSANQPEKSTEDWLTIEQLADQLQTTPDVIRQVNRQYKVSHNHPDWTSGRRDWRFNPEKVGDYRNEYGDIIRELTQLQPGNDVDVQQEPIVIIPPKPTPVSEPEPEQKQTTTQFNGMLGVKAFMAKLDAIMELINKNLQEKEETEREIQSLNAEIQEINQQAIENTNAKNITTAIELLQKSQTKQELLNAATKKAEQLDKTRSKLRKHFDEAKSKLQQYNDAIDKQKAAEQAVQDANEAVQKANDELQQFLENGFNLD